MNGETPSVPITTLAGMASLTDLLPELPLPTPLPHTMNNKSLLYHPSIADESRKILSCKDDALVSQMVHGLRQTTTDHIELKDSLAGDSIEGDMPDLLKTILSQDPNVFKGGPMYNTASNKGGKAVVSGGAPYYPHQHPHPSPYQAGQISPCPPGSPARVPPQPVSTFRQNCGSANYQEHFPNFTQPSAAESTEIPVVNGGSPSLQTCSTPYGKNKSRFQKPATVSSPAQATSAPLTSEPPRRDDSAAQCKEISGKGGDPKDTSATGKINAMQGLNSMLPKVSLTRIDDALKKDRKEHKSDNFGEYAVVSSSGSETKLTIKLFKTKPTEEKKDFVDLDELPDEQMETPRSSRSKRLAQKVSSYDDESSRSSRGSTGAKRKRIEDDDDNYNPEKLVAQGLLTAKELEKMYGEYSSSLSERVKRRRRNASYKDVDSGESMDEDESVENLRLNRSSRREASKGSSNEVEEGRSNRAIAANKKKKKPRRIEVSSAIQELKESTSFKRFSSLIDGILESAEETDFTDLNLDGEDDDDGNSADSILSNELLNELCSEAAKLKSMGVMNQISTDKLVKVLTLLQYSIRGGNKLLPRLKSNDSGEEEYLWRELATEKILPAVEASLSALYIMTSPNMPKEVFIEDVIERLVHLVKIHLKNTIFPEFDPVYRLDPKKTLYQSNSRTKKAKSGGSKHRSTMTLYNKLTEVVGILSELVDVQELTDTIILQTTTLAVEPFFVENISELQLSALKLVTSIFSRYEKHRQLILEDILSSLKRLPSSKKNLRSYRLNAEEYIQMVTALALELIQCVVKLPVIKTDNDPEEEDEEPKKKKKKKVIDDEVMMVTSYETAIRTALSFLSVFLKKCSVKGEEDYRHLFENFVYDLLSTVNKPEWPAAELLLSLLGRLLVRQFSNKSVDMSLRVASLDYLGIVAARLRKDAVSSRLNEEVIDDIIKQINENDSEEEEECAAEEKKDNPAPVIDAITRMENCTKTLLDYLAYNGETDPSMVFARQFYIGQWFRDCTLEVEKVKGSSKSGEDEVDEVTDEIEKSQDLQQKSEKRKEFLLTQINTKIAAFATNKPPASNLDDEDACLITRYIASSRPFSQSFDIYLTQILKVLCESSIAVRTKAMKCLTAVVEADPSILARQDMQRGVHGRFLDQSTSVREAAVELVGRFVLIHPELSSQYYDMLSERILDTGISVRKRVIKIFRDICLNQPDFKKIPEMCVKMIRRVNDEEGIKKLVNDTFQNMWFTPTRDKDTDRLLTRVMNITDVVAACRDTGYDWFEQLLENLLKKEETSSSKPVEKACTQIADCLVENVLILEESSESNVQNKGTCSARFVACISTLYLLAKVKAELLVPHTTTLQPYLDIKCNSQRDLMVLHNVARILELAVPLMEHPSESFLTMLEEDMMKLILKHGTMVLQSCISCLGAIVNEVTHNYKLVRDCFQKYFSVLSKFLSEHKRDPKNSQLVASRPTLLRSLFTVGLLCRNFDFDSEEFGDRKVVIKEKVFDVIMYFVGHEDEEVKYVSLAALGFLVTNHYEFMLGKEVKELYHDVLSSQTVSVRLKCQVLRNLNQYLIDEESRMMKADAEWKKVHDKEDLKEMGDIQSGMASTVIQVYLKQILNSSLHSNHQVRLCALNVVSLILRQGLVHPVQCVPYLICMGADADCDSQLRIKADQELQEIDKKYPGFVQMKSMLGVKMSYQLQRLIQQDPGNPTRGIRIDDHPVSLNHFIFSLIRNNRGQRRALLSSMLNMFDDTAKTSLPELLYMADNLAYFPYQVQDEPLFLIHQIDIIVSVSGSNLLQSFREIFYPGSTEESSKGRMDDDEDEDVDTLLSRMPENVKELQEYYIASRGCVLLLVLKQHLKDMYGFTDTKVQRYSPTDAAKVWDRPVSRKNGICFNPKQALELIKQEPLPSELDEEGRRRLIEDYLDFKDLMLSIDPDDNEEDSEENANKSGNAKPFATGEKTEGEGTAEGVSGEDGTKEKTEATTVDLTEESVKSLDQGRRSSAISTRHSHSSHRLSHSSHRLSSGSDRKRHSTSSRSRLTHSKPTKHKKKKRKRIIDSDDDEDSDDDDDPDFTL